MAEEMSRRNEEMHRADVLTLFGVRWLGQIPA